MIRIIPWLYLGSIFENPGTESDQEGKYEHETPCEVWEEMIVSFLRIRDSEWGDSEDEEYKGNNMEESAILGHPYVHDWPEVGSCKDSEEGKKESHISPEREESVCEETEYTKDEHETCNLDTESKAK